MKTILLSVLVLGVLGAIFGALLAFASKIFHVEVDPRQAAVREQLEFADNPKSFDGFPIALVTAGLIALAFMGFSGLKVW